MREAVDVVVVGAGVVGLAVARAFSQAGREVLIVEREAGIGLHTSSRNSEVIHAGIYYEPQSLKAKLCVRGNALLHAYCASRHVGIKKTGKLIIAQTQTELGKLQGLRNNAIACGVDDLVMLDGPAAMKLEPELRCVAALLSPSTGIVDGGQLLLALLGDAESNGAVLAIQSEVVSGEISSAGIMLDVKSANGEIFNLLTRLVINCAGHGAHDFAASVKGYDRSLLPPRFLAKGSYCSVSGMSPFTHLVYPIPVSGALGIHVTNDLAGSAKLGPDIVWTAALNYDVNQNDAPKFKSACEGFWPGIKDREVVPSYCGVRPKISGPGEPNADFMIQTSATRDGAGLVNLFGIESPGLTSSIAIAEYLLENI
jgi:L-2-hydroxyglutarate oxidase LhgO